MVMNDEKKEFVECECGFIWKIEEDRDGAPLCRLDSQVFCHPKAYLTLADVKDEIRDGKLTLDFTDMSKEEMKWTAEVLGFSNKIAWYKYTEQIREQMDKEIAKIKKGFYK
jgi:hypothetical protein